MPKIRLNSPENNDLIIYTSDRSYREYFVLTFHK